MNRGDDERRGTDDPYTTMGGTRQTRTRMPDDTGAARPRAPRARASRSTVTVVGVAVLLIAAIAFVNRGPGSSGGGTGRAGGEPESSSTAATGDKPVTAKGPSGIPSGFARSSQGAQSAASNYTVALNSADMFKTAERHRIIDALYTPEAAAKLNRAQDAVINADFLKRRGLDAAGNAPAGSLFVSRTLPVGTKVSYADADSATVSVWYSGLVGMSAEKSTNPVKASWNTLTFQLKWVSDDWKIVSTSEKKGPTPLPSDETASDSGEISRAVEEYGGFTYAR
ncbi:hypothetical protein ACIP93_34465 [Streptomyces sp. NPDC088745]|uniref:hypothetical protein n=1 Tax=Streptomyces sp. NPDC088745 TaxID=3365884 RepID=UPI00382D3DB3